jgi:diguanylate cyclase (GGDEF)-like protein
MPLSNSFFLITANLVGIFASYLLERYRRSNFYQAETIRSLASHDALTGLWNRRIMMERLTEEAARIHRYGGCSSIIEIDLDNFKTVNDTLGHSAGDNVLREFASLLVKLTRETDYAFRFGGDEFILLVPGTRGEQAAVIADKVKRDFANVVSGDSDLAIAGVGCSIGVVEIRKEENSPQKIMEEVDKAMYEAKSAGKANIVVK